MGNRITFSCALLFQTHAIKKGKRICGAIENLWCLTGCSEDYKAEVKPQNVFGENILFYRQRDEKAVAVEDICYHRKFPLWQSQRCDDNEACGYHGLTFNSSASCEDALPRWDIIPKRATVKFHHTFDLYRLLWIRICDPANEDPNDIFKI